MTQTRFLYFFNGKAHFRRFLWGLVILASLFGVGAIFIPAAEAAPAFSCDALGNATGNLFLFDDLTSQVYDNTGVTTYNINSGLTKTSNSDPYGGACTNSLGIFGRVICFFKSTVGQIVSEMYCRFQVSIQGPLSIAVTLFVCICGVLILSGVMQMNVKESVLALIKIALVWAFATNATYGIQIGYAFFMGLAEQGSAMVLDAAPTTVQAGTMLTTPDSVINTITGATASTTVSATPLVGTVPQVCLLYMIPILLVAFTVMPVVAINIVNLIIQYFWLYARALLGYLTALVLIGFLFILSPLFISFALFQVTRPLFEQWLKYLTSFSLQMVIVFGFLAILNMLPVGDFFREILGLLKQDTATTQGTNSAVPRYTCSLCNYTINPALVLGQSATPPISCIVGAGAGVIPMAQLFTSQELIQTIVSQAVALWIIGYVMQDFMRKAPELANKLTGRLPFAATLGGSSAGAGASEAAGIQFAGLDELQEKTSSMPAKLLSGTDSKSMLARASLGVGLIAGSGILSGAIRRGVANTDPNSPQHAGGIYANNALIDEKYTNLLTPEQKIAAKAAATRKGAMGVFGSAQTMAVSNDGALVGGSRSAQNTALYNEGALVGGVRTVGGADEAETSTAKFITRTSMGSNALSTPISALMYVNAQKSYDIAADNLNRSYGDVQKALHNVENIDFAIRKNTAETADAHKKYSKAYVDEHEANAKMYAEQKQQALAHLKDADDAYLVAWDNKNAAEQEFMKRQNVQQASLMPQDKKKALRDMVTVTSAGEAIPHALTANVYTADAMRIRANQTMEHLQLQSTVNKYLNPKGEGDSEAISAQLTEVMKNLTGSQDMEGLNDVMKQLYSLQLSMAGSGKSQSFAEKLKSGSFADMTTPPNSIDASARVASYKYDAYDQGGNKVDADSASAAYLVHNNKRMDINREGLTANGETVRSDDPRAVYILKENTNSSGKVSYKAYATYTDSPENVTVHKTGKDGKEVAIEFVDFDSQQELAYYAHGKPETFDENKPQDKQQDLWEDQHVSAYTSNGMMMKQEELAKYTALTSDGSVVRADSPLASILLKDGQTIPITHKKMDKANRAGVSYTTNEKKSEVREQNYENRAREESDYVIDSPEKQNDSEHDRQSDLDKQEERMMEEEARRKTEEEHQARSAQYPSHTSPPEES